LLAQFGLEASTAVTYVIAFAIIFVLLTLFALVLRRLTGRRSMLSGQGGRTRQPRLGIVDVYDLDRQRQLILLRRDNVEHLLLIGGPNDVVIETNIVRVPGARVQPAPEPGSESNDRPPEAVAARPVVEALPLRTVADAGERGRGNVAALATETAAVGASLQPSPTRGEAVLKPDVVALQGGRGTPRRPEAPPAPAPAPPARPEAPRRSAPIPPALAEPPPPGPAPVSEPKGPDAAILSDMAKQLEEALKRPMAPTKPPGPIAAPMPAPRAEPPARPPAPPPARPPAPPAAPPPPRAAQPDPVQKPPPPPPAPPRPAPPTPAPAPVAAGPAAEPAVPPKPAPRPEPPVTKPEARAESAPEAPPRVSDPFSVEEIEAEFARLLGRPFDKHDKGDKG
jgi:hypothetical protein